MMILADVGNVAGEARERLGKWIDDGGVLVRFAGPRLAAADDDLGAGEAAPWRPHRSAASSQLGAAAAARRRSRAKARSTACRCRTTSPSRARCWPSRTPASPTAPGRRSRDGTPLVTASQPRQGPDRSCSTSPPTRAGPTCRCPARSSRCSSASSRSPARPRQPSPRERHERGREPWCRRPACSTASARSARRRRPRGRSRRAILAAPTRGSSARLLRAAGGACSP